MTTEASVSISWVNTVLAAAQRQGLQREQLLARAGVREEQLTGARLPVDDITRLWRAAAELTGDPGFGLKVGCRVGPASFNIVSYILLSSATLRDAIGLLQQFQRLISDGGRFQLLGGEAQSWLIYHPQQGELAFSPQQLEAVLAAVISFSRWVLGQPVNPERVQFSHGQLGPLAGYQAVFQCPADFQQAFSGLQIANALLDSPLPQADAQLATLHREYAAAQLAELSQAPDFRQQVTAWLQTKLTQGGAQGVPERVQAASRFGLSERVFARRLQAAGGSYQQVVDDVRRRSACQAVAKSNEAFGSIAARLGFSEASAFNRAFRRWTGGSPGDWRQAAQLARNTPSADRSAANAEPNDPAT